MSSDRATALRPRVTPRVPLDQLAAVGSARISDGSVASTADAPAPLVGGITLDSRLVRPGDLYVALPGRAHHGAEFAAAAVRAGAVAVLTDEAGGSLAVDVGAPVLVVADPRRVMAPVAARIYGEPARSMTMFGITGTNGKTTTSFLLDAALRAAGRHTGVIGTIGFTLDGAPLEAARTTVTTPEAPELQALLAVLSEGGAQDCVMEVSSHALTLGRVDAILFDVAAFTNLGRDHLDFHGDLESYFRAKALLFTPGRTRRAVVSLDDARGRVLVDQLRAGDVDVATVSIDDPDADYSVSTMSLGPDGLTTVLLHTPSQQVAFALGLPGVHNVRNAVTALAMIDVIARPGPGGAPGPLAGVDLRTAAGGLAAARVPGRMELVELGADAPVVFVDFAHTPTAVSAALAAVAGRRRIAVLGCGGDRDPDKRGPMGAAAAVGAEVVVVTDDNPRSEDPAGIRQQVLAGARAARQDRSLSTVIVDGTDRRTAIGRALALSRPSDVLLILGKGHEQGQEIAGAVLPFRDVDVVRDEWAHRATAGAAR